MTSKNEVNDFLNDFRDFKKKVEAFKGFSSGQSIKVFFKELDKINELALHNLALKHTDLPSFSDKKCFIATKSGIKTRRRHGSHGHDLGGDEFVSLLEGRSIVADWISQNRADKVDAFNDLMDAVKVETNGFGLKKAVEFAVEGTLKSIDGFGIEVNKPILFFDTNKGEAMEGVLRKLSLRKSWANEYQIRLDVVASSLNSTGTCDNVLSFDLNSGGSGSRAEFNWFVQKDAVVEMSRFLDLVKEKLERNLKDYEDWKAEVKDALQSYYALVNL